MGGPLALAPDALAAIAAIGSADVVVGVPPAENDGLLQQTVAAIEGGLCGIPAGRAVIVTGHGSAAAIEDGAAAVAGGANRIRLSYPVYPVHRLSLPYHGIRARGLAFQTIFEAARLLGARACAVVDAADAGFTAACLHDLITPVLRDDFDFVAPRYPRPPFDGMIVNGIVYPMTRALYGLRVRQLVGPQFAFSGRLLADCLAEDVWNSDVSRYGIEIALASVAMADGYRPCEVWLGTRGLRTPDATADVSTVLVQVVGCVFAEMARHVARWQKVRGSADVPRFGEPVVPEEDRAAISVQPMLDAFHLGMQALGPVWSLFVSPAAILELRKTSRACDRCPEFPDDLWVRVVHDFALGYRQRTIPRDQLLQALTPLYLGWLASFVHEMSGATCDAMEQRLEALCLAFERRKGDLIARWRWPDRFNP